MPFDKKEDPVVRLARVLDVAKSRKMATIAFHDPDLGEVRCAFYEEHVVRQDTLTQRALTADQEAARVIGELTGRKAGTIRMPKPPPGWQPDESGLD